MLVCKAETICLVEIQRVAFFCVAAFVYALKKTHKNVDCYADCANVRRWPLMAGPRGEVTRLFKTK